MTVNEYYAMVRRLGLQETNVPHVYRTSTGEIHRVPDATQYTDEQRAEIIERLKRLLGVGPSGGQYH